MTWSSQGNVTFTSLPSGAFPASGGTSTRLYVVFPRVGSATQHDARRYTLSANGLTATLDSGWSEPAYWRSLTIERDGTGAWFNAGPTAYTVRRGVVGSRRLTRQDRGRLWALAATYILPSMTKTPTRLLWLNSASTEIRSITPPASSSRSQLTENASETITLTSGAGTGLTNPRLFTDDTYVWVSGVSSDR